MVSPVSLYMHRLYTCETDETYIFTLLVEKQIFHAATPSGLAHYSSQLITVVFTHAMHHHLFTSSYTQTLSGPISNLAVGVH